MDYDKPYPSKNQYNNNYFIEKLIEDMAANGLPIDHTPTLDDRLHRYSRHGRTRDLNEWYIGTEDAGYITCTYGSWSQGEKYYFQLGTITPEIQEKHDRLIESNVKALEEKYKKQKDVAETMKKAVKNGRDPTGHPYLQKKKALKHNTVEINGELVIPLYTIQDEISTAQRIDSEGNKKFVSGGRFKGTFWTPEPLDGPKNIYVTEGFATASSVHQAIKQPVVAAMSLNNIYDVLLLLHNRFPRAKLHVCQDVGSVVDKEAEKWLKISAVVVHKPRDDRNGYDFNDLHLEKGLEEVKKQVEISAFKETPLSELLQKKHPPTKWLINDLIAEESATMVYAQGGVGKSRFLADLALACVERTYYEDKDGNTVPQNKGKHPATILKWHIHRPYKVLYIDTELAEKHAYNRFKEAVLRRESSFNSEDISILCTQEIEDDLFNLYDAKIQEKLDPVVEKYDIIIIDNLQNAMVETTVEGGACKENSAAYWTLFFSWVKKWKRQGKTFFLAHHAGKNGEYRGTSRAGGDVDNILKLSMPDRTKIHTVDEKEYTIPEETQLAFVLTFEKMREASYKSKQPFLAMINEDSKFRGKWVIKSLV